MEKTLVTLLLAPLLALAGCEVVKNPSSELRGPGQYKGYVMAPTEICDVDKDGKVDVIVNSPREKIANLDFYSGVHNLTYRKALIKQGYCAQYPGEDVEIVPKDFFDDMFPVREDPNK